VGTTNPERPPPLHIYLDRRVVSAISFCGFRGTTNNNNYILERTPE
jgi:hypothetical protein